MFPDQRVEMREVSVLASLGWHPTPRWGVGLALGAIVGGLLVDESARRHEVRPGVAGSISGTWLALTETSARPFVSLGLSFALSRTETEGGAALSAGDLRASFLVGKTLFDVVAPFFVARAFGGPVSWDRVSEPGGDAHHYAIGAGATVRLDPVDLFVEAIGLGEQSLSAGAGLSF